MIKNKIISALNFAIKKAFEIDYCCTLELAKDLSYGDYQCNDSFLLAKTLKKSPLIIASSIANNLESDDIEKVDVVNGFINIRLKNSSLITYLDSAESFKEETTDNPKKINVEFVSANPTGELHIGHARQAAIGDTIARLLTARGHFVTKEYYINDAGVQVDNLAKSLIIRIKQLQGSDIKMIEDGYHGEDVIALAKKVIQEYPELIKELDTAEGYNKIKELGIRLELDNIKERLSEFRVEFDKYSSELLIRKTGKIEEVLRILKEKQLLYEDSGATWLKSTLFNDDKDRVLIKSDGTYTYLTPDLAYHLDKIERGYELIIDVLGADHYGYLNRMRAGLIGLKDINPDSLVFSIVQMVRLFKDGGEFKLSKRSGNSLTIKDLVDTIGVDASRYIFVSKSSDSHMDIDVDLVTKKSDDNPVFYIQYAYARISSMIDTALKFGVASTNYRFDDNSYSRKLLLDLFEYPSVIRESADTYSPYKLTLYLSKLASSFHSFYSNCRIVNEKDSEIASFRLLLSSKTREIIKKSLELLGVRTQENM